LIDEKEQALYDWAQEIAKSHQVDDGQIAAMQYIRLATRTLLLAIARYCPPGPDRSAAIRKVREAMMTANAAITVPDLKVPEVTD